MRPPIPLNGHVRTPGQTRGRRTGSWSTDLNVRPRGLVMDQKASARPEALLHLSAISTAARAYGILAQRLRPGEVVLHWQQRYALSIVVEDEDPRHLSLDLQLEHVVAVPGEAPEIRCWPPPSQGGSASLPSRDGSSTACERLWRLGGPPLEQWEILQPLLGLLGVGKDAARAGDYIA